MVASSSTGCLGQQLVLGCSVGMLVVVAKTVDGCDHRMMLPG
jgi:hypothetical protein